MKQSRWCLKELFEENNMNHGMPGASADRRYEDFQPSTEWVQEKGSQTFLMYLPGFRKEQLKVQVTSTGNMRISGERPLGNHSRSRFHEERAVPSNCNINAISAKFEGGMLYVKLPNKTTPGSEPPRKAQQADKCQQYNHPQPLTSATRKEDKKPDERTNGNPKEDEKTKENIGDEVTQDAKEKSEEDGLAEARIVSSMSRGNFQLLKFIRPKALMNLALFVLMAVVIMLYVTNAIRSLEKNQTTQSSDGL